ncbi:7826_t:CDS:2, partial [Cetraspora pellucida]
REYDFSVIRDYFIPHTIITSPQPCSVLLIEYTLELLAVAGEQEAKSKWSRSYSPIKRITIVTPEARSVGDALRKLDAK